MSDENNFYRLLEGYYGCSGQEKRLKETCAALTLIQGTLHNESISNMNSFTRRIQVVADEIRNTLEDEARNLDD